MFKNKAVIAVVAIFVVLIAIVLAGGWWLISSFNQPQETQTPAETRRRRSTLPINELEYSLRPVVTLEPDGIRNILVTIQELKKTADSADYTLEYQTGELLQGATGKPVFDQLPTQDEVFLGSCSAGGACTFHEDIRGGTLEMEFLGEDPYLLKADWRYIENPTQEVASQDAKFQLSAEQLSRQTRFLVFNGFGYPSGVEGEVISQPYNIAGTSELTGSAELSIRADQDGPTAILGWDGQAWQRFEGQTDGKTITAQVELLPIYVAVK